MPVRRLTRMLERALICKGNRAERAGYRAETYNVQNRLDQPEPGGAHRFEPRAVNLSRSGEPVNGHSWRNPLARYRW